MSDHHKATQEILRTVTRLEECLLGRTSGPEQDEIFTVASVRLQKLRGVVDRLEAAAAIHGEPFATACRAIAAYAKEGMPS